MECKVRQFISKNKKFCRKSSILLIRPLLITLCHAEMPHSSDAIGWIEILRKNMGKTLAFRRQMYYICIACKHNA